MLFKVVAAVIISWGLVRSSLMSLEEVRCCKDRNCTDTCVMREHEECFRSVGKYGRWEKRRENIPGCEFPDRAEPIEYRVDGDGVLLGGQGSCGTHLCNKCPLPYELCIFPGRKNYRDLKCFCTPEGMKHSRIQIESLFSIVEDFSRFCIHNECRFSEIDTELRRKFPKLHATQNFEKNGYSCANSRGKNSLESFGGERFGCDFLESKTVTFPVPQIATLSRVVNMVNDNYNVECNDFDQCNTDSMIGLYGEADVKTLQSCPFSSSPSPCAASSIPNCYLFNFLLLFISLSFILGG